MILITPKLFRILGAPIIFTSIVVYKSKISRGKKYHKNKFSREPTEMDFPRQSFKRFTFLVKSSDSIFFLLGPSPKVN